MRGDQPRQVDRLEGKKNTEPRHVPHILNPQVASPYELEVAATDARRGTDRSFLGVRDGATGGLAVLMSPNQEQGCKLSCSCICHAHHRLQSPLFMDGLLGSLCVRYSGCPAGKPQCNEYFCRQQSQFRAIFIYSFPQWFLGVSSQSHRLPVS